MYYSNLWMFYFKEFDDKLTKPKIYKNFFVYLVDSFIHFSYKVNNYLYTNAEYKIPRNTIQHPRIE